MRVVEWCPDASINAPSGCARFINTIGVADGARTLRAGQGSQSNGFNGFNGGLCRACDRSDTAYIVFLEMEEGDGQVGGKGVFRPRRTIPPHAYPRSFSTTRTAMSPI